MARTPVSQAGNTGSNPVGGIVSSLKTEGSFYVLCLLALLPIWEN